MLITLKRVTGAVNEKLHREGGAMKSHKRFRAGRAKVKKLFGQYEKFCLQGACLLPSFSAYLKSRSSSMSSCRRHWKKKDFDTAISDPAPQWGRC